MTRTYSHRSSSRALTLTRTWVTAIAPPIFASTLFILWWARLDSNQRRETRRVYSPLLLPLSDWPIYNAVRWKQPQTPLRLSLITLFCLSILEEPDIAPILWRDRRHRRFFLFLKGVLVYALIHQWWNRWDLNPQPFPCKGIALPIAPRPHVRPPFYRVAGQMPLCVTHFRLKWRRTESCSVELSTLTLRQDVNFP